VLASAEGSCDAAPGAFVFTSPERPDAGRPLRVIAITPGVAGAGLVVRAPDGADRALDATPRHGPPRSVAATVAAPAPGTWRLVAHDGGRVVACHDVEVAAQRIRPDRNEHGK